MLIRKQGNLIKVLRVTPPTQPPTRGRRRENVVGIFRADEAIPSALLDALTHDEHKALACWLAVDRESLARKHAGPVLSAAVTQLESLVSALEVAADALLVDDADRMWAQFQAITRTLRRAGHPRPRTAQRPPAPLPGQRDFFGEFDGLEQLAEQ